MDADRRLVADYLKRRREAPFRQLYRRHTPRMIRLSQMLVARAGISPEDVVQEAWIRATSALDRFEWRSSLATWLAGIVVNIVREQRRRETPEAGAVEPETAVATDPLLTLDLTEALRELPHGYRSVVALHDVAGFTHAEIGAILGIDPGTSKSQLARARRHLRTMLSETGISEGEPE